MLGQLRLAQRFVHKTDIHRTSVFTYHLPSHSSFQQTFIEWWQCPNPGLGLGYRGESFWVPALRWLSRAFGEPIGLGWGCFWHFWGPSPWLPLVSSACASGYSHLTSGICRNGSPGYERPSALATWTPSPTPAGTSGLTELKTMIPTPLRWA